MSKQWVNHIVILQHESDVNNVLPWFLRGILQNLG